MSLSDTRLKQTDFRICKECNKLHMGLTTCPECSTALTLVDYTYFVGRSVGKYKIENVLGIGGMGIVFKAIHQTLNKQVAIKFFISASEDPSFEKRFLREARILAGLKHPNIIEVYDFDISTWGTPYYVMEFLEGETLGEILRKKPKGLSFAHIASLLEPIIRGLGHAHKKGIIHRDLKPDNIFIEGSQDQEIVKILDFGIAKSLMGGEESARLTATETVLGTPYYLTPEQILNKNIGPHTDQYALALIVGEMISGEVIRGGKTVGEILYKDVHNPIQVDFLKEKKVPSPIAAALIRATMPKPAERFPGIHQFGEAILQILNQESPDLAKTVQQPNSTRRQRKPLRTFLSIEEEARLSERKRRYKKIGLIAAIVIVLTVLIWIFLLPKSPVKNENQNSSTGNEIQSTVKESKGRDSSTPPSKPQLTPKSITAAQIITTASDSLSILTLQGKTILLEGEEAVYLIDRGDTSKPVRIPTEERVLGGLPKGFIAFSGQFALTVRNFIDGSDKLVLRNPPPSNISQLSSNEKFLASKRSNVLTIYRLNKKKKTTFITLNTSADNSAFSMVLGNRFLAYIDQGKIYAYRLTGEPGKTLLSEKFEQSELAVEAIEIQDTKGLLAVAGKFDGVYLYELENQGKRHKISIAGHTQALAFSSDSPTLYIAKENTILCWRKDKGITEKYATPNSFATDIEINGTTLLAMDKKSRQLFIFDIKP